MARRCGRRSGSGQTLCCKVLSPDDKHPEGKLRLLYECKPLAFVAERAGGRASTGTQPVLTVPPESAHQRIPLAIGSRAEVELYEQFVTQGGHS